MAKVLFVERDVEYVDPMNIELLSALARRAGHATFLCVLAWDDLETELRRIKPDVVAFSAKTGEHSEYFRTNRRVKRLAPSVKTVIGGPHATFFPGLVLKEPFDAVAVGECDEAWPLLLNLWENGAVSHVPNVVTAANAHRVLRRKDDSREWEIDPSHLRPRKTNLDDLPFLDRELVYRKAPHLGRFPMRTHMASRGCPFVCSFCFEPKFNQLYAGKGPVYNRYSVPRLCAELKEAKERWGCQFVKFYDDMFILSRKVDPWLAEFADAYPREVGAPFFCLTRCNVLTEETLKALKRAGCHSLTMSIEAGNEHVRNKIIRRQMTERQILDAYALCEREGIVTFANTILGIPVPAAVMAAHGKTALDYDVESLDINIRARVTYADFPILYPYPGCELTEYVVREGFHDGDFDRLFSSYHAGSPFACFTNAEKLAQKNLSLLGPICVMFPRARWLRNLVVSCLIHWPLTRLYFVPWYVVAKAFLSHWRVYPMRISWWRRAADLWRGARREWGKRARAWRLGRTTTQTLGGPPPMLLKERKL